MKNQVLPAIIAVICTIAICLTAFFCVGKVTKEYSAKSGSSDYMTEAEAAEYLGIDEARLTILRKNLKYLEGTYMVYTFADDAGEEVSVCMYSKSQLNKVVEKLMGDTKTNSINFKYIEQALKEAAEK
ncbi:MAG: hypothetical protein IJU45_02595 [Clostridia bacterium]|nr:hypothetical protein [Clostridia bacterium]